MVTINIEKDRGNSRIAITAEGHAGAGDPGQDPVCAGISAMMIGYAKTVIAAVGAGFVDESQTKINVGGRPGHSHIETVCLTDNDFRILSCALMPVELFFKELQENNPENVKLLYHPCGE